MGLPTEIEILWGQEVRIQRVDYWKIPLRCHICCCMGHLKDNCPDLRTTSQETFVAVDASTEHAEDEMASGLAVLLGKLIQHGPDIPFLSVNDISFIRHFVGLEGLGVPPRPLIDRGDLTPDIDFSLLVTPVNLPDTQPVSSPTPTQTCTDSPTTLPLIPLEVPYSEVLTHSSKNIHTMN